MKTGNSEEEETESVESDDGDIGRRRFRGDANKGTFLRSNYGEDVADEVSMELYGH